MRTSRIVLTASLGLVGLAVGQGVSGTNSANPLAPYPLCSQKCIVQAFLAKLCAPTDQLCICSNEEFQGNVSLCVAQSCTIPESLVTRNISLTSCGSPVRDRSSELKVTTNVMLALCLAFVVARIGYQTLISQTDFGFDDWILLSAQVFAIPSVVITNFGTIPNGLGRDIWTLTPNQITDALRYFYMMISLYFLQTSLVKLSLIAFFLRIFPSKGVQRLLWGTFIFVVLWGIAFIITAIFPCRPIEFFWTRWDGFHTGACLDLNAMSWSNASLGIALDLWIVGVPLWQLKGLKLHWKKKIGVALMFLVGALVTFVSILRLRSVVDFAKDSNVTWTFYDITLWSTIEISVGIICACMPAVRLLFTHFFPALRSGSQRGTTTDSNRYKSHGSAASHSRRGTHGRGMSKSRIMVSTTIQQRRDNDGYPLDQHESNASDSFGHYARSKPTAGGNYDDEVPLESIVRDSRGRNVSFAGSHSEL